MARKSPDPARLETLSRQLDAARSDLGHAAVHLRQRLDLTSRVRDSLRRHPAKWFGASAVVGLVASLALTRLRRKPARLETAAIRGTKGRIAGAAVAVFTLLRPVVQKWMLLQLRQRWSSPDLSQPAARQNTPAATIR